MKFSATSVVALLVSKHGYSPPVRAPTRMERKIFEAFSRVLTDGENGWLDVEEEEDVDEDEALDEVWTAEDDEDDLNNNGQKKSNEPVVWMDGRGVTEEEVVQQFRFP